MPTVALSNPPRPRCPRDSWTGNRIARRISCRDRGGRRATVGLLIASALGGTLLAGCQAAPRADDSPSASRIVILQSATANEPRGQLTERVRALLQDAADNTPSTDGLHGKGAVVDIVTVDQQPPRSKPLTPRRQDGKVEHGMQRGTLITDNIAAVETAVAATTAQRGGVDEFEGIDQAVRGLHPATLVILGSGLSTAGGLDLRQVGWHANPADIVAQLQQRRLLPDLTGWTVLFSGLGSSSGAQDPLPTPTRSTLVSYWTAICQAAHAASCQIDDTRLNPIPPAATVLTPTVPVEGISSITGPDGLTTTTINDAVLGFAPNSATLGPGAQNLLTQTAARITAALADRPAATVTVRGWTANPPDATRAELLALSRARAQAVADALQHFGVAHPITVIGGGPAPSPDAMATGRFDEVLAVQMRRSEITY